MAVATKPQNWGDDLRLPSLTNPADTAPLLAQLEQYRKISLPLQSKHLPALKRNSWFALRRPTDKSRTGLIVIWPERACCLFLAADGGTHRRDAAAAGRFALLRLRLDPQLLAPDAGLTVLAATLSPAARRLWVEDLFVWKGRDLLAVEPFSTRLRLAAQWLEHYCMLDPRLLGGLEMEMAAWQPLGAIQPEGAWEILQADAAGVRRFFWLARRRQAATATPTATATATATDTIELVPAVPHDPVESGPPIAVATRESGPDQWGLSSADGVSLGRALIRTMSVSSVLRTAKANTMRVEVVWAAGFGKWEIKGIAPAGVVASSSSVFMAASK